MFSDYSLNMISFCQEELQLCSWLRVANISHTYVCKCTSNHTHKLWIKTSPQNDQKPILTFLTDTEVGHLFSALHASIFYSAQESQAFHRKAPTTLSMCCSPSIFISTVSRITEHLYLIASYEGALPLRSDCFDRPDCSVIREICRA